MTASNKLRKELNRKLILKRFFYNLILVCVILCAIIFLGFYGGIRTEAQKEVFGRNVSIDGVQVGGLSFPEAEKLVLAHQQQYLDSVKLTVQYEGEDHVFDAKTLAISTSAPQVLQEAYEHNKQAGSVFGNYMRTLEPVAFQTSVVLDEEKLFENMTEAFGQYSVAPVNATAEFRKADHSFVYTDGSEGKSVDIDQLLRDIALRLENGGEEKVVATTKIILPQFTKQSLESNSQLIAESKTAVGVDENRLLNMQLMSSAVSGMVLQPGEVLSLNTITGGYTIENGYVEASVEEDGTGLDKEVGGGVGQFASTLYNAALLADMEVVEREKNLWPPSYIKVGLDARVSYDDVDLKVKNRSNFPMYFGATISDSVLDIAIYGQPLPNQIVIENRELNYVEAPHAEVVYTDELPEGEQREKSISRAGYEVEIYRHYLDNGKTVSSELISHDIYKEIRGVIMQGTGGSASAG